MKPHPNKFLIIKLFLFFLLLFSNNSIFGQRVLSLEDALSIALKESYSIQSSFYALESSQKNLEASKMGLRTSVDLEFDLPRYSRSLQSQFNTTTGKEEFFEVGNTTIESRIFFNQPIAYTNGTFSLVGSLFGRDQLNMVGNTNRDYYSNLSFRLRQPLFTFNSQAASLQRAEINLEKSQRNYTRAEREIIYMVTASFYNLFQAKKSVEIANERVKQTQTSYETAMNKFKAGLIAEVEALQLEVDLSASKNELLNAESRFDELNNEFKLLIGLQLSEKIDVSAEINYTPIEVDESEAITRSLQNRPEIKNSEADIALSGLAVSETDSRGNISALLSANYGVNKNDQQFKDIFKQLAEDRSITFTISVPVWDWSKNQREVESAEANLKIAHLTKKNQTEQIEKEVRSVLNKLRSAKARVDVLSKSVELAQKSYDISISRFDAGTITSFDLSQLQLRLTNAKTNSLNALIDYLLAVADLSRKTYHNY
jgi:outer membrane protein TolC